MLKLFLRRGLAHYSVNENYVISHIPERLPRFFGRLHGHITESPTDSNDCYRNPRYGEYDMLVRSTGHHPPLQPLHSLVRILLDEYEQGKSKLINLLENLIFQGLVNIVIFLVTQKTLRKAIMQSIKAKGANRSRLVSNFDCKLEIFSSFPCFFAQ